MVDRALGWHYFRAVLHEAGVVGVALRSLSAEEITPVEASGRPFGDCWMGERACRLLERFARVGELRQRALTRREVSRLR